MGTKGIWWLQRWFNCTAKNFRIESWVDGALAPKRRDFSSAEIWGISWVTVSWDTLWRYQTWPLGNAKKKYGGFVCKRSSRFTRGIFQQAMVEYRRLAVFSCWFGDLVLVKSLRDFQLVQRASLKDTTGDQSHALAASLRLWREYLQRQTPKENWWQESSMGHSPYRLCSMDL